MEQTNKSTRSVNIPTLGKALCLSLFVLLGHSALAQDAEFETFSYEEGDSTYIMQKYFLVFLKQGPNRSQDEAAAAHIQKEHLAYLGGLYEQGFICMNGPFGDDGEIRGATVYRTTSLVEAQNLASNDPAVKAGRLSVEVHPWWLARGTGVH